MLTNFSKGKLVSKMPTIGFLHIAQTLSFCLYVV